VTAGPLRWQRRRAIVVPGHSGGGRAGFSRGSDMDLGGPASLEAARRIPCGRPCANETEKERKTKVVCVRVRKVQRYCMQSCNNNNDALEQRT